MATRSYCRHMQKVCVCVFCVHCVSINLCWPGVFSSLHSCFPQTGPTELCALMPVCVCVCVNLWQSDGLTGGLILSEGCFFQTLLSSSSLTFFPFSLQRQVRSGPPPPSPSRLLPHVGVLFSLPLIPCYLTVFLLPLISCVSYASFLPRFAASLVFLLLRGYSVKINSGSGESTSTSLFSVCILQQKGKGQTVLKEN